MLELCRAIKERLDAELAGFYAPVKGQTEMATPQVHIGGFPHAVEGVDLVPLVVLMATEGEDGREDGPTEHYTETNVDILCTIITAEEDERPVESGHQILMALTDRLRQAVRRPGPLADRYRLVYPVTWDVMDLSQGSKNAHPYYAGRVSTKWREDYRAPALPDEIRGFIHGDNTPGTDGDS